MLAALILKELRAVTRDVHALLALFLMPTLFIVIMSLALRDGFRGPSASGLKWEVLDEDASETSKQIIARFSGDAPRFDGTRASGEARVAKRELDALVVIEKRADAKQSPKVIVLADPGAPMLLVEKLRGDWEFALARQRMAAGLAPLQAMQSSGQMSATQAPLPANLDEAMNNALQGRNVQMRFFARERISSVQQSVPAWLVFSMFFVVLPVAAVLIAERTHGTLDRLRSLNVPAGAILLGKLLPFFAINQLQMLLMLLVGRYLVPLLSGDALALDVSFPALMLISTATSVAALGVALLIAAFARTTDQATTMGGFINIIFGALGGVMVPRHVMPPFMQEATNLSPMAWGLQGFIDVFARRGDLGAVWPESLALMLLGLAALSLAAWRLGRT